MIIYNVTVSIDDSVHDEWLEWMKTVHIPDVMETGLFSENRICRVLSEDENEKTYSLQYTCASREDFNRYQEEYAPALQAAHTQRYKDKFVAFRTVLQVLDRTMKD